MSDEGASHRESVTDFRYHYRLNNNKWSSLDAKAH